MAVFSSAEFAEFNALLASAVERGLPLEPALALLAAQAGSPRVRAALETVQRGLREGKALTDALRAAPEFPPDYVALVEAGLAGGRLADVLRDSASYQALVARVRGKFVRFFAYLVMGLLLSCGVAATAGYVGLQLQRLSRSPWRPSEETPLEWMADHPFLTVGSALALFVVGWLLALLCLRWISRRRPGYWIPLWGRLLRSRDLALLCSVLGLRLGAGTPLPEALRAAAAAIPNRFARRRIEEAAKRVAEGVPLSDALFYSRWFPRMLAWSVSLGERRSELPQVFSDGARIYAHETERCFEMLFVVLAPLGLLALGNVAFFSAMLAVAPFLELVGFVQ